MGQGFERGLEQAERQVIRSRRQTLRPKVDSLFPTLFHFFLVCHCRKSIRGGRKMRPGQGRQGKRKGSKPPTR
jgi:hypothetical protein